MKITSVAATLIRHRFFVAIVSVVTVLSFLGLYVTQTQPAHAYDATAFVIRVKTDNPGSATNQFIIPTVATAGQSFDVDCEDDGVIDHVGRNANTTCTYATPGTYTIAITGNLRRIYVNNAGDRQKILSIEQWGTAAWSSMDRAFNGASNMVLNATDTPNLTGSTTMSLSQMFRGATALVDNGGAMNSWDTSTVTNMAEVFHTATNFNSPIGNWNTSNVVRTERMFVNAAAFNQPIGDWDVSNVTTGSVMFSGATNFNQPLGNWDVSKMDNLQYMFNEARSFNQDLSDWDISSSPQTNYMFYNATSFDRDLGDWDVSHVTVMTNMFGGSHISIWPKMSVENYDNTLIGWLATGVSSGVTFGAPGERYCVATAERTILAATHGWNITDGGRACPPAQVMMTVPTKLRNVPITDTTVRVTP